MNSTPKRFLFLHNRFGSGHEKAAEAALEGCKQVFGDFDYMITDSIHYTNPYGHHIYERLFQKIIIFCPALWDDIYFGRHIFKFAVPMFKLFDFYNHKKLKILFDEFNPDIVVSTHHFCSNTVNILKDKGHTDAFLVSVATDYCVHKLLKQPHTNLYIMPSIYEKNYLIKRGVPKEMCVDSGIPIRLQFNEKLDQTACRTKLGLDENLFTVIIMGGTAGHSPFLRLVEELSKIPQTLQIITIAGTNKHARQTLLNYVSKTHHKLVVTGFVNNMHEYMTASDLTITKPGGVTVSECLALELPMILSNPLPGQERPNLKFVLNNQLGLYARNMREARKHIMYYLKNPHKLEKVRQNIKTFARPDSARQLALEIKKRYDTSSK